MRQQRFHLAPRPSSHNFNMWLPSSATLEQVVDQVDSMNHLEISSYARRDYMHCPDSPYSQHNNNNNNNNNNNGLSAISVLGPISPPSLHPVSASTSEETAAAAPFINERRRRRVVNLLYEIADYCHFRRETVAYAIYNVLDRYLSSYNRHPTLQTASDLQLVAFTSLYISVKVLEPVSMDLSSLADLSRGAFGVQDVCKMEKTILSCLQWNVAVGPTPVVFVQHFLTLLQLDLTKTNEEQQLQNGVDGGHADLDDLMDDLLDQAQYQVELAVADYFAGAVDHRNLSDIALAAIWNALESQLEPPLARQYQARIWKYLDQCGLNVKHCEQVLAQVQLSLCKLQYAVQQQQNDSEGSRSSCRYYDYGSSDAVVSNYENIYYPAKDQSVASTSGGLPGSPSSSTQSNAESSMDKTESNEVSNSLSLIPSPVSVVTKHFSANLSASSSDKCSIKGATSAKNTDVPENESSAAASYSGLSYIRKLFFA